ncbi:MAG: acyl carrier protein [Deltaproteobacteria bacterium]|jgi:acyl carrier protein|nr:acyl carrier protein [Deltaproteobacteria bacterium]
MQVDEKILQTVCEILRPLVTEGQEIREETDIVADLGLDSLKVMKLVETVEDSFDISVPLNVLPEVRTVGDFVQQIEKINKDG